MKRVILLTLSLLLSISSHSQTERGMQTTHPSIVLTITTAWIRGKITQNYIKIGIKL